MIRITPKTFAILLLAMVIGMIGGCAAKDGSPNTSAASPAGDSKQKKTEAAALDRAVLPIAEPDYPRSTVLDARDAKPPPRFQVKAPASAPNVLIVLVDDMGFGMPSAF